VVPRGVKRTGNFRPAHAPGPSCQKPGIAVRQAVLAMRPWHLLDPDAAPVTLDPAQRVNKEHQEPPEGNELEAPRGQPVVTGLTAPASRTQPTAASTGSNLHLDFRLLCLYKTRRDIHKTLVRGDPIEDCLYLHPALSPGKIRSAKIRFFVERQGAFQNNHCCTPLRRATPSKPSGRRTGQRADATRAPLQDPHTAKPGWKTFQPGTRTCWCGGKR